MSQEMSNFLEANLYMNNPPFLDWSFALEPFFQNFNSGISPNHFVGANLSETAIIDVRLLSLEEG